MDSKGLLKPVVAFLVLRMGERATGQRQSRRCYEAFSRLLLLEPMLAFPFAGMDFWNLSGYFLCTQYFPGTLLGTEKRC